MLKSPYLRLAALIVFSFTLLVGCSHDQLGSERPASKQQEALAISEVDKLRRQFNENACQMIFHDATFANGAYLQKDWLDDCARFREDLGKWSTFVPNSVIRCGGPGRIVCIEGLAQFEKGTDTIELGWLLGRGSARLLFLVVHGTNGPMQIPSPPQKLIDPPPERVKIFSILLRHEERSQS
jgi:hypothetical protein